MQSLIRKYYSQITNRQLLLNDRNLDLPIIAKTSLQNEINIITEFVTDLENLIKTEYLFFVHNSQKQFFEKYDLILVEEEQKGTELIPKPYYAVINRLVGTDKLSISVGGKTWTISKYWAKNMELLICKDEGVYRNFDSIGYSPKQKCIIGWSFFDSCSNSELKKIVGIYPKSFTGYPMICKSFAEEWCVKQMNKIELTNSELDIFIIKQQK